MTPLIDADLLLYAAGFASQMKDEDGETHILSWEHCQEKLENQIQVICEEVGATEPPILFLSNSRYINKHLNRKRAWEKEEEKSYIPLFREQIAVTKGYKAQRIDNKPYHYFNLITHILGSYNHIVNEKGLEADDAMCIYQCNSPKGTTIICSRDKDVRQCEGWHYSWEHSTQGSIGPLEVVQPGEIRLIRETNEKTGKAKQPKLFGLGNKYFYAQLLMGDAVDNVGGAKKKGPVSAYELLKDATSERECFELTSEVYRKIYKEDWKTYYREQADLLWMIREVDEEGNYVKWKIPKK